MKLPVYNNAGEKIKDLDVNPNIFSIEAKPEVVHQVVVAQNANARQILAHTKDKSEVRGGGAKPWRQKGTGRARHGSSRSPIWSGGGVTFGPTKNRNFSKMVNKKQKQLALSMCLSDKAADNNLAVMDKLEFNGKTKDLNNWIKDLKTKIKDLKEAKKFLLVLDKNDKKAVVAAMNLDNVDIIMADSLNCVDVLKHDRVLASEAAISVIEKHYKTRIKTKETKKQKNKEAK